MCLMMDLVIPYKITACGRLEPFSLLLFDTCKISAAVTHPPCVLIFILAKKNPRTSVDLASLLSRRRINLVRPRFVGVGRGQIDAA